MSDLPPKTDPLIRSVMETIDAGLGVGVALARTAAVAVSGDRPVPRPPGVKPVPAMLFYAATTVKEIAAIAGRSFNMGASPAPNPPAPARATLPLVGIGGTLRVPLSIENPGEAPMTALVPEVRAIRRDGADARAEIPPSAIHFEPAALSIAPRDFEKLTVFLAVPRSARPGRYDAVLALGPDEADLPLSFEVTAA